MNITETTTLKEIADLPFIEQPRIRFEIGKIERITHLAVRNGISLTDCYQELYCLNRNPNFKVTFIDSIGGEESVRIEFILPKPSGTPVEG